MSNFGVSGLSLPNGPTHAWLSSVRLRSRTSRTNSPLWILSAPYSTRPAIASANDDHVLLPPFGPSRAQRGKLAQRGFVADPDLLALR